MKFKIWYFPVLAAVLFSCSGKSSSCTDSCPASTSGVCSNEQQVPIDPVRANNTMAAAQKISLSGSLVQYPVTDPTQGYVYLKVDERFIDDLFPLLGNIPSGFTKDPNPIGAHISVFSGKEMAEIDPQGTQLPEVGQSFSFSPCCLASWTGKSDWIVLQVESPELMCLLQKYKVPTQGVTFHISIAQRLNP